MGKKTTVAELPDEAYEQIKKELAVSRTREAFLTESIDLINDRSNEADFIKDGGVWLRGYTAAIQDLGYRLFNREFDFGQDMPEPDYTDWEGSAPF